MSSILPGMPATSRSDAPPAAGNSIAGTQLAPMRQHLTPARKAWVENVTILLRHKRLILWTTVLVTIAAGAYAFLYMPNYYKATAVVLPARKPGGGLDNMASSLTSSLKDLGLAKLSGGEESYTPVSLMTSRELQVGLLRKFGFQKIYGSKTEDDALKEFAGNLDCELTTEGNFVITFEDTSAARAAEVANAAVLAVNEINSKLAKDEAQHNLKYMEQRFFKNLADLDSAEAELQQFERTHGIYLLPEQARTELGAIAELEQQKGIAEIQLKNTIEMYGQNSGEASALQNVLNGVNAKLNQMRTGMDSKASSFVPTNILPEAALKFLRLTREVEIQSKLKGFFLPLYEQAKLDENRNLLSFVTLDHATVPSQKSRPKRSTLLLSVLVGTAVLMAISVVVYTRLTHARKAFAADRQLLSI